MPEKIQPIFPKTSVGLTLKVDGIFAFPDEWKTTDDVNPGLFTYTIKFCNMELVGGKIAPRELTDKQIREQEEAKKKGGKKEPKKQQNAADAEKLKQMLEREEAEEKRREEAWSKMNDEERFYFTCEDKYKSPVLKFQHNSIEKVFNGNLFVILEERVLKDKGEWIYLYKYPTANEQELEKLKKSKPKNLNLADLNPVCVRAWVNLESLNSPDVSQAQNLRCKLHQTDQTQQSPKPNLQKCYIKLCLQLSQAVPQKQDSYSISSIIHDPAQEPQIPAQIRCIQQMHEQLRLAIQSLAMQYSAMFWKDLNVNEEQKCISIFVTNKKNQNNRRKEQFLYDFNVSGKYKVLKERLKKIIVHLCESKFVAKMDGAKSFTGITCSVRDQFYSEIYNYLVTSYTDTMRELTEQKKQKLREVLVLNSYNQQKVTEQHLQEYRSESQKDRFDRIIKQYLLIGNYSYGQQMYKEAITKDPENIGLKYQYSLFCMRNGLNSVSQVLSWGYVEQYIQFNKTNTALQLDYAILMIGSEDNKSLRRAWVILRQLLEAEPSNIQLLLLAALTIDLLGKTDTCQKIKCKAYRQQLRRQGKIKAEGKHHTQPMPFEIPSLHSVATYKMELKPEEKDNLWIDVMGKFSEFGIYPIVQKIKGILEVENNPKMKKEKLKILYFQEEYTECREKAIALYKQSKDFGVLQMIVNCCHKLKDSDQKIRYLKIALIDSPQGQKGYALINLGFFYLMTRKYGNAKACLTKYLDTNKKPGGLSWMILGQAQLMCNNETVAVDCFRHANLCDPYNKEVWVWLAQAYVKLRNFIMVNQCLNCYLNSEAESKILKPKLHDLKQQLSQPLSQANFYETSIKQKLVKKLQPF